MIYEWRGERQGWIAIAVSHTHLIVTFTEELEPLSFLVHKNTIEMTVIHTSNLDCLVAPTHNLSRTNVCDARRHLAPLKNHRFRYSSVSINIYALVIVAE